VKRLFLSVAGGALAIGLMQTAHGLANAQPTPQASATVSPTPTASPTSTFALPTPKTSATPAPPKDTDEKRVGISGVWEVQIQQSANTVYTHFKIDENGSALIGQYLDTNGKRYPIAGSLNGKDVHLVVNMSDGTALVFDGTVEGGMDMAGTITTSKDIVGFTAAYRPKYKWLDNLSPNPGLPGTP
jgi:hypothetical protein